MLPMTSKNPKVKKTSPVITMRMEATRLKRIDYAAHRLGVRRSALIQIAISEYLERVNA